MIHAIIKGRSREAIDACAQRKIPAKFIQEDILAFGSSVVTIDSRFEPQIRAWFNETPKFASAKGYPIGTLLYFKDYSTQP